MPNVRLLIERGVRLSGWKSRGLLTKLMVSVWRPYREP
jgi:hypothetical protein